MMDEGSPYFISKNKHKNNTKKNIDPDSQEEEEENENESLSEIKNVSSQKRAKNLISDENEDKFDKCFDKVLLACLGFIYAILLIIVYQMQSFAAKKYSHQIKTIFKKK